MKKKYILIGILAKVAYDKFMAQTEFGKKWRSLWCDESYRTLWHELFSRKISAKEFVAKWI